MNGLNDQNFEVKNYIPKFDKFDDLISEIENEMKN